jgi:hypothetical protein
MAARQAIATELTTNRPSTWTSRSRRLTWKRHGKEVPLYKRIRTQSWPHKIVWSLGFATLREIIRRAGDDEQQFVGHANRNHIAFEPFADANSGIETLGHDVGQVVIKGQIQGNVRKLREKAGNGGG